MDIKKIIKISGFVLLSSIIAFYLGLHLIALLMKPLNIKNANGIFYYDKNSNLFNGTSREWIKLDDISKNLINATIASEDKNFYKHDGFDYPRIIKAIWTNIESGKTLSGASTISQQYVKNLFLNFDKTIGRKIKEAWLTIRLESHYSKEEILEGYLNTINYGNIFGIENASKYYFGKSAKNLTLGEASLLAGIPKWPTRYEPINNFKNAKERQKEILRMMVNNNYISEKEMNDALNEEIVLVGNKNNSYLKTLMYYQDAVNKELNSIKEIPKSFIDSGSLKIYTNLDLELQTNLENNINKNLSELDNLQIASIIVEPSSGKILALTGGRNYYESEYNRAISAKRSVGSTIKPFLYYEALKYGFTPSTTFTSERTTFVFSENQTYSPKNYGNLYAEDDITLASAIVLSDNIYAIKTHLFLGEEKLVNIAKKLNISDSLTKIPSLALGSEEISLLSMIKGYQVLANEGVKIEPYLIDHIEDSKGNIIYKHKTKEERLLETDKTFILNSMLSNCTSPAFVSYSYPTCTSLIPKVTRKYAIKTGSTNKDNLIFGYNKDILMGVWVGYDDNKVTGASEGKSSKFTWAETVEGYLKDKENTWYKQPDNVVGVLVDTKTGKVATNESNKKSVLYYLKGTEPK